VNWLEALVGELQQQTRLAHTSVACSNTQRSDEFKRRGRRSESYR
jgi:hypothetical protein